MKKLVVRLVNEIRASLLWPAGGFVSDRVGKRFGMRGRLWSLWVVQTVAGLLCVLLGRVNSLWASMVVMCVFSFFVQAASGLTFGVVPFVSKRSMGVISGMTGSGGTLLDSKSSYEDLLWRPNSHSEATASCHGRIDAVTPIKWLLMKRLLMVIK